MDTQTSVNEIPDSAQRVHVCHQDRMLDLEDGLACLLELAGLDHSGVIHRFPTVPEIAERLLEKNSRLAEIGVAEPLLDTCDRFVGLALDLALLMKQVRAYLNPQRAVSH